MRLSKFTPISRRELLAGATGMAALSTLVKRGDAQVTESNVRLRNSARACIFVNLMGAPSHLDTFDVKDAPWNASDLAFQQGVGGIVLSQTLFPELSRITSDLCVLRSITSWEAAHERGQFYLQTAHPSNPAFARETPNMGAIIGLERGGQGLLPPFLSLNATNLQGASFLGGRYEPLSTFGNRAGITTLEHNHFGNQSRARFEDRYKLLQALDSPVKAALGDEKIAAQASYYETAKKMMYDQAIASVFQFTAADEARYGNTNVGKGCIVARNAVRANSGAAFISVAQSGWDMHQNMFDRNYAPNIYQQANDLDRAVGSLVADLKSSGELSQTLIVIMGEFGRTPGPLNGRGGRDHHKDAMSAVMVGGGVRGGQVIGATDATGAKVIEPGWSAKRPIVMEDVAATIYTALGINYTKGITETPSGRKFEYVPYGSAGTYLPVEEVFA